MDAQNASALLAALKNNIGKVIVGREETVELLLTALLCDGHALLTAAAGRNTSRQRRPPSGCAERRLPHDRRL